MVVMANGEEDFQNVEPVGCCVPLPGCEPGESTYTILLARSKIMVVYIRTLKTSLGKERERERD